MCCALLKAETVLWRAKDKRAKAAARQEARASKLTAKLMAKTALRPSFYVTKKPTKPKSKAEIKEKPQRKLALSERNCQDPDQTIPTIMRAGGLTSLMAQIAFV